MTRRVIVLLAAVFASLAFATPASADGATSVTQNFHGAFPLMHVTSLCGSAAPGGTLSSTGNAVFHITVNAAAAERSTTTQKRAFTLVPHTAPVPHPLHSPPC